MKKLPLAIQLYSLRSLLQERFNETLQALADTGFTAVELFGGRFGDMAPEQLADFFHSIGIKAVGCHFSIEELLDPSSSAYKYAKALKFEFVTVSMPGQVTSDTIKAAGQLKEANKIAAGAGFVLTYHNHDHEFAKMEDGRTALDTLFDATADDELNFLFDVFFAFCSGFDPCEYLKKFVGRVPQVHLNDLDPAVRDSLEAGDDCMTASTELGTGCMDLKAVYETAVETGVRWVVLEQHKLRDDPLESARCNFEYYKKLSSASVL